MKTSKYIAQDSMKYNDKCEIDWMTGSLHYLHARYPCPNWSHRLPSGSVALVVSQPRLQRSLSPVMTAKKPRVVLSFVSWDHRHRDLRGLLAHALSANVHFADGCVLNAIEVDASEEMGEPLPWYPVAHMTRDYRLNMYPREGRRQDKKALGNNFILLQDSYYEHAKLTLILDKGGSSSCPSPPSAGLPGDVTLRNQLVLAYKSLEDSTDPNLLAGWVRWSGAWEAYTLLQDRKLPVATITLYVRENFPTKIPKETFKYVVMLEIVTHGIDEVQQLRAATQRLRVERWSGYICLYTEHSLIEFSDNFSSNDSISKIVEDVM
ncbi:uncharacterized protein LOC122267674 [Penaeus japonicus]|uniref:uncharacterized protein LOC122267674 n=1 Tax=Penaeus japonicus TaxID=27405 RepID=UPI001C715B13|nr:uncharacterized protein LOC122267674 [Penaeus japonicus]